MATKVWIGGTASHLTDPSQAANWSPSGVPADGDSIIFPAVAAYNVDGYDYTAGSTIHITGLTVENGCTIAIGSLTTPAHFDLKRSGSYYTANLAGSGQSFIQIDNYDTINIMVAASAGVGAYGLVLTGVNDSSTLDKINISAASNQSISIGTSIGGVCKVNSLTVAGGNVTVQSAVVKYDGAAAPNLTISGGSVTTNCPLGTVNKYGGTLTTQAGAIASFTASGGNTYHESIGTMTAGTIGGSEIFDCSGDLRAKTITSFTVQGSSATYKDPNKVITNTNPIQLTGGATPMQLNLGTNCGIARS